ncbi:MAG: NlpC/P60 family protein [Pseudomonadota bacterium]
MTESLDRRLHAFRADLADVSLKGHVAAESYAEASVAHVAVPVCEMRPKPDNESGIDTQLVANQQVGVFHQDKNWAWVQAQRDGYVGYVPRAAITFEPSLPATHVISVPRTFSYPAPDLKRPAANVLSMGTHVANLEAVEAGGTRYARVAPDVWVIESHLNGLAGLQGDFVSVAETLLNTPYLWGGCTAFGIDCSGLVQLSLFMCGHPVLRDSDMQFGTLGKAIDPDNGLRRGDLIFWKGHVAIVRDTETIIHANGHTMSVAVEKTSEAIERIAYLYAQPIGYKRL